MDFGIPEEILQDMYELKLEEIETTHTIELRIYYKVNHGEFNAFSQSWSGGEPTEEYKDVLCSYREDNRIGEIVSSEIVNGYPSGNFKIFIPYENRIDISSVSNYVEGSMYFKLRPNSVNPIILIPKVNGITIEYLCDKEQYALTQRILCTVRDFV